MYVNNGSRQITSQLLTKAQERRVDEPQSLRSADYDIDGVIIIEARHLVRECLVMGLESCSAFKVAAYETVSSWIASGSGMSTAVLLLSAGGRSRQEVFADLDALAKSKNQHPIVILAQHESLECILEMLGKGARGYVPLSLSIGVAVEAIRLVKAGGTFVPASSLVASRTLAPHESSTFQVGDVAFTHRQAAVLETLCSGKANKTIAYELNMQESTVKVHIRNIMRKLNAKNRTEVAVIVNASRGNATFNTASI